MTFRFNKETICFILIQIGDEIKKDSRGASITIAQQLFLTLRFFATGAFYKITGDTIRVHEATVCRTVRRVSLAICRLLKNVYITFSDGEELRRVKNNFAEISG